MKIIFKDFFDNEISEDEAGLSEEYSKVFIAPDGSVKKEEMYSDKKLKYIHYYKDPGETEADAREQSMTYKVPFSIKEREPYGNFTIIKVNAYNDALLTEKWKFLADNNDFVLCTQLIDINSGEPIYEETTKYLGEFTDDIEPNYCKFNYDSAGNFAYCDYNYVRDYESDLIEIDRLLVIKERFDLTDEMYNYYLTAELLPPLK